MFLCTLPYITVGDWKVLSFATLVFWCFFCAADGSTGQVARVVVSMLHDSAVLFRIRFCFVSSCAKCFIGIVFSFLVKSKRDKLL